MLFDRFWAEASSVVDVTMIGEEGSSTSGATPCRSGWCHATPSVFG